jgi:arylsulfatase A-like enzyme
MPEGNDVVTTDSHRRRVLIIGADGLRPDLFDRNLMPNVTNLAETGVRFIDHHAAYPSHTRVNMSTLATGTWPGRHGIVANTMLIPGATPDHVIDTSSYEHLDALDAHSGGKMLRVPSLGEILNANDARLAVAGTGSAGSNLLWTRNDRSRLVNPGTAFGIADLYDLREKLDEIPPTTIPHIARLDYATRAVTDLFLDDARNRVIVLWFAEPDSSLHHRGLGSPESIGSLKAIDELIVKILEALDRKGLRDQFDIFFMSDHGHSTVRAHKTLREYLLQASRELDLPPLATASDFVYAKPGSPKPTAEQLGILVGWLYAQPWTDILFTRDELPGTLPLSVLWAGELNERAPLLAVSPTWSDEKNEHGVPGIVSSLTTQSALKSSHGSLSPFDMHATLVANGPSFKSGLVSSIPTGAVDLMPTVLTLLGIDLPSPIDGRVLTEALTGKNEVAPEARDEIVTPKVAVSREVQPRLRIHRVGNTTYVHGTER